MAGIRISQLPVASAAGSSPTVEGGVTKQISGGGGGISPVGKHGIPVMAPSILPRRTNGCAALAYLTGAANQPDVPYLAFAHDATEYAQFAIAMPPSWDEGTVSFVPIWAHPATTTNFGTCWKLRAVAVSNDDALAATFGTPQSSVDAGGTTHDAYLGTESSAITVGGTPQPADLVFFEIQRTHDDAGDTLAVDAYLIGVMLYITTATGTDG